MSEVGVKGGIVIEQLKRYAKRLSDSVSDSASAEISVWYHPHESGAGYVVELGAFAHGPNDRIKPRYYTENLRDLGAAIDDYINGNSKTGKENEK